MQHWSQFVMVVTSERDIQYAKRNKGQRARNNEDSEKYNLLIYISYRLLLLNLVLNTTGYERKQT